MKQEEIKNILEDLYKIDEDFKKHEKQLTELINQLILAKPDTKFDQDFKNELKTKLIIKAEELMKQKQKFSLKKIYYFAGVLAVMVLIIVPTMYLLNQPDKAQISFGLQIAKVSDKAYGSLQSDEPQQPQAMAEGRGAAELKMAGGGGGGGFGMLAPEMINYKFVYAGDDFDAPAEQMEVLKRIKGIDNSGGWDQILSKINFDAIDISKFSDSQLQNLSLTQDKEYGLAMHINLEEGMINVSQNYLKWPNPFLNCRDENCYKRLQLSIDDVPSDESLLKLADEFVKEFNIDASIYGEPYIDNLWQENYEQAPNKADYYIPEQISIVYPLMINGQYIYDQGDYKHGLNININIREMKVAGLYNLTSQNYQSSSYQTANAEEILKVAEQGGYGHGFYYENLGRTVELEIGTPTLALFKIWHNPEGAMQADELIVPAYIFPILTDSEKIPFWQKNIIVPLIADLLKQNDGPRPMPLVEPAQNEEQSVEFKIETDVQTMPPTQPAENREGPVELKIKRQE